jgi:ribokinase
MTIKPLSIAVLGDTNIDAWFQLDERPRWDNILHSDRTMLVAGGKGLNMALGVARLGAKATLLSVIGDDAWGLTLRRQIDELLVQYEVGADLAKDGDEDIGEVNLDHLLTIVGPTPICGVITNRTKDDPAYIGIKRLPIWHGFVLADQWKSVIAQSDVLMACLSLPINVVCEAIRIAHESRVLVVLNPGPPPKDAVEYQNLVHVLEYVDIMVPNDYEARQLIAVSKTSTPNAALSELAERLQEAISSDVFGLVCITKGRDGFDAICNSAGEANGEVAFRKRRFKGQITAIITDPLGRGDAFCSSLTVELANGKTIDYALRFAATAASLATRTPGAAAAMPDRQAVQTALSRGHRVVITETSEVEPG